MYAFAPTPALMPTSNAGRFEVMAVDAGELHNNVRMTWGKALLPWVSSPEGALKMAVHLNHKFALDGCNPCSYSGILWCFGQFDAPKGEQGPLYLLFASMVGSPAASAAFS